MVIVVKNTPWCSAYRSFTTLFHYSLPLLSSISLFCYSLFSSSFFFFLSFSLPSSKPTIRLRAVTCPCVYSLSVCLFIQCRLIITIITMGKWLCRGYTRFWLKLDKITCTLPPTARYVPQFRYTLNYISTIIQFANMWISMIAR